MFIEIDRPIDDRESQDQIVEIEAALVEVEAELAEVSRRRRPYANINVVLAGVPTRWTLRSEALTSGRDCDVRLDTLIVPSHQAFERRRWIRERSPHRGRARLLCGLL